jgi:type I restriction enzyme S subunit
MKSWSVSYLRDVAEIVAGITLGRKTGEAHLIEVPYLRVANVQDGRLSLAEVRTVAATQREIERLALRDGDLLLTEGGDLDKLGRGTCWRQQLPLCIHQNHIFRVRLPESEFDPDFCSLQIGSPYGKAYFAAHAKKTTGIASINQQVLGAFPLLCPPLSEQRALAADLKLQLAAVEDARQAAEAQLKELALFANAIVRESSAHPDAQVQKLGDVLVEMKQGVGQSWAEFPVLGATRDGLAPAKESVGKHPERYKPVGVGSVFYNPMRILIGSIAMVDAGDEPGITSPDYVVLRGRDGVVDSRWFYHWLRAPEGEHCIASLARGAVRERMLFNRLAEGEILLPPHAVQEAASQALAELRPMKAAIEARLRDIEQLPQRLLAQAFAFDEEPAHA